MPQYRIEIAQDAQDATATQVEGLAQQIRLQLARTISSRTAGEDQTEERESLRILSDGAVIVLMIAVAKANRELTQLMIDDPIVDSMSWQQESQDSVGVQGVQVSDWAAKKKESNVESCATASTEISRLETLPAELRNYIYELVLTQQDGVVLAQNPRRRELWMTMPSRQSHMLALTAVNTKIRSETLPLFYALNDFTLDAEPISRHLLCSQRAHFMQLSDCLGWYV